jgi:gliding motility-associated-like protein
MVQTGNVTVTVLPVQADFTYTYITNNQVDFTDLSLNGSQFHWDFGDGSSSILENPSHNYADTGVYVVTLSIINDVGCVSTVQHPVEVYPPYHLYVPNAFTPDDDGLNDYFMPVAVGVLKSEMFIFNRWGGIIFQSNERNAAWNGRDSNGDKVQLGVYVYLLKYSTPIGQHYTSYGTVTLLR